MAVDQKVARQNWASKWVNACEQFMAALEVLGDLDARATSAGLTFVDSDFAGTALAQLDAATLANARTIFGQIKTQGFDAGSPARKDALNKMRP